MKNVSHENKWDTGTVQVHLDPPHITLIRGKKDEKLDKAFIKIKFCRDPTSENLQPYEFKMSLFDNVKPEEFLLFIPKFNMVIETPGTL